MHNAASVVCRVLSVAESAFCWRSTLFAAVCGEMFARAFYTSWAMFAITFGMAIFLAALALNYIALFIWFFHFYFCIAEKL